MQAMAAEIKGDLVIYTAHGEEMPRHESIFRRVVPEVTVHVLPMGAQNALDRDYGTEKSPGRHYLGWTPGYVYHC